MNLIKSHSNNAYTQLLIVSNKMHLPQFSTSSIVGINFDSAPRSTSFYFPNSAQFYQTRTGDYKAREFREYKMVSSCIDYIWFLEDYKVRVNGLSEGIWENVIQLHARRPRIANGSLVFACY